MYAYAQTASETGARRDNTSEDLRFQVSFGQHNKIVTKDITFRNEVLKDMLQWLQCNLCTLELGLGPWISAVLESR